MASRPDFLPYSAQSFPAFVAKKTEPYVPPTDYPVADPKWLASRPRPGTPPQDYSLMVSGYPYSNYAEGQYPKPITGPAEPPIDYTMKPSFARSLDMGAKAHGNRAFIHHLKNHQKYDTYKSFRTCDGCPICQAMDAADVAFHRSRRGRYAAARESDILSGRIFEPVSDSIEEEEEEEEEERMKEKQRSTFIQKLQAKGVICAHATRDRVARKGGELTVAKGELLEILLAKKHWWNCANAEGRVGWVPANILKIMKE